MKYLEIFERFFQPPVNVRKKLDSIINRCLDEYGGGIEFFSALDSHIKDIINEDILLSLTKGLKDEWVATSGGFGDTIYKLWKDGKFQCKGIVVFNGKMMTNDIGVKAWYPQEFDLNIKSFIYLDDSYFSGGTYRKINSFLKHFGSSIKYVYVVYDGSKIKLNRVKSFFRYYDR